jgi:threonine/homoserine/homoserine lactone efflux protein
MHSAFELLASGLALGLVAGISPGPLLMLVIGETIRNDRRTGLLVASAPLITDAPVVLLSVFLLSRVADYHGVLGVVSLAGAGFVGYLAYGSLRTRGLQTGGPGHPARSFRRGLLTNVLSPHPYLFWITVGAPLLVRAENAATAASFVAGFYVCLVGSKVAVALAVDRSKGWIQSRAYLYIMRSLGALLLLFAVLFLREGLRLLGVLS